MTLCGLDFGTSNSTLGIARDGHPQLIDLEGASKTLPSAIFFDFASNGVQVGRAAIESYVEGMEGRLMRSVKSVLGTELIDQDTTLKKRRIGFREVLATLLGQIKRRAEQASGRALDSVVHGRPVHFVDGDEEGDAKAQADLEQIAKSVGFKHVSFQYEPIAAALDYERQVNAEQVALIADIGGGTSDVSVIRLGPGRSRLERAQDILSNDGLRLGGTDFDAQLSLKGMMPLFGYQSPMLRDGLLAPNHYFTELATWSKINFLYTPQAKSALRLLRRDSAAPDLIDRLIHLVDEQLGHWLAMRIEDAKIKLSAESQVEVKLNRVQRGLIATITRTIFDEATQPMAQKIADLCRRCVADAGLKPDDIDAVFLTGGTTLLPHVRKAILDVTPAARVVDGDKFGSVGTGLTLEAMERYG
ncbi:MAG TPA: Hsp70 family protein [Stellaceae bacterium]|nr:Hsp70 family protein [Stellaceae bacterium]